MDSACFNDVYIARLQDGDRATQEHFASHFRRPIRLKAWRYLGTPDLVDDVYQETLLRVFRYFRSGKGLDHAERLPAFVHSVCHNVAMEVIRARSRHLQIEGPAEDPVDSDSEPHREILTAERKRVVLGILSRLPDRDRELLRLAVLEGADRAELSRRFGANQPYVRVLLHRALRRCRAALLKTDSPRSRGSLASEKCNYVLGESSAGHKPV